jgi:hypothetical protein
MARESRTFSRALQKSLQIFQAEKPKSLLEEELERLAQAEEGVSNRNLAGFNKALQQEVDHVFHSQISRARRKKSTLIKDSKGNLYKNPKDSSKKTNKETA